MADSGRGGHYRMMTSLQQLRLMQLSSASLPIGGFTYSQGLEWAVEAGWVSNVDQFYQWQSQKIEQSLIHQDLPLLLRLYRAAMHKEIDEFDYWAQYLLASRETLELRSEERQRGEAMMRVLHGVNLLPSDVWHALIKRSQISCLAWAGCQWKIPVEAVLLSLSWSSLESSVIAGMKLVPFGQMIAQSLLLEFSELIASRLPAVINMGDDYLGGSLPMVAIASSCHETQHTRLFRS